MSELKVDRLSANASSSITVSNQVRMTSGAIITGSTTSTGGITAAGKVESQTQLESISLDINGDGDVSGTLSCGALSMQGAINANTLYVQGVQVQPHIVAFAKFDGSSLISTKNVEGYTDNGSGSITFDFATEVEDNAYVVLASTNDSANTIEIGAQATDSVTLENVPSAGCSFLVLDVLVDELIDTLTPPVVALDDLTDVTINTPLGKQVLYYTGTEWRNASLDADDVGSGTFSDTRIAQSNVKQYEGDLDIAASQLTAGSLSIDLVADTASTRDLGSESVPFAEAHADRFFGEIEGATIFSARNESGATLTKGKVVYINGVSGTKPTVDLADADDAAKMPAFGLVYADAPDNSDVDVVTFGTLGGIDTSAYSEGDIVYVSTTAGDLTATPPTGESSLLQNMGKVVRSHASAGSTKVIGAGRTNATPNLDQDKIFLGNASNQSVSTALSSVDLTKFNNNLKSSYTGQIETAADKTYTIDPGAATARTITGFYIQSNSGTCTATLKNGTTTISTASVSSISNDQLVTNTSVAVNDVLTIVVSSNSSATDVVFAVEYTG